MRVLVCGGRDWTDTRFVSLALTKLQKELGFDVLIEGDARGIDRIAGYWARKIGIDNIKFPAEWEKYGSRAGPIRNAQMLRDGKPDLVIAFPGGRGTIDMVNQARTSGVPVRFIEPERHPHDQPQVLENIGGPGRTRTCNQTVMSNRLHD
jgi:hypothetical protein